MDGATRPELSKHHLQSMVVTKDNFH